MMILTKLFKEIMEEYVDYEYCDRAEEYLLVTMYRIIYFIFTPLVIILDVFLLPIELISIKTMKMKEKEKKKTRESKIEW